MYVTAAGAVARYDPPLVAALKAAFARPRPSNEIHLHSFAFPSGHATAAAFLVGTLLLVLLPLAWRLVVEERLGGNGGGGGDGVTTSSSSSNSNSSSSDRQRFKLPDSIVLPIWAAAWGLTASGRVLADSVSALMGGWLCLCIHTPWVMSSC